VLQVQRLGDGQPYALKASAGVLPFIQYSCTHGQALHTTCSPQHRRVQQQQWLTARCLAGQGAKPSRSEAPFRTGSLFCRGPNTSSTSAALMSAAIMSCHQQLVHLNMQVREAARLRHPHPGQNPHTRPRIPQEMDVRSMTQAEREDSVNEIRLMASVDHPNVIGYNEAFLDGNKL